MRVVQTNMPNVIRYAERRKWRALANALDKKGKHEYTEAWYQLEQKARMKLRQVDKAGRHEGAARACEK